VRVSTASPQPAAAAAALATLEATNLHVHCVRVRVWRGVWCACKHSRPSAISRSGGLYPAPALRARACVARRVACVQAQPALSQQRQRRPRPLSWPLFRTSTACACVCGEACGVRVSTASLRPAAAAAAYLREYVASQRAHGQRRADRRRAAAAQPTEADGEANDECNGDQ
jgi:hypothetical protein